MSPSAARDRRCGRYSIDDDAAGAVFGLKDRGQLRAGAFADVLIFDLAKVNDAATYEKPHQLSEGIDDIIVNGELARRNGRFTTALAGRVLRPERQ